MNLTYDDMSMDQIQNFEEYHEILCKEVEPYLNTIVINGCDEVCLFTGLIAEEEETYCVFHTHNGIVKMSVCFRWIPLKGVLPDDDYKYLVNGWNKSNTEKAV